MRKNGTRITPEDANELALKGFEGKKTAHSDAAILDYEGDLPGKVRPVPKKIVVKLY